MVRQMQHPWQMMLFFDGWMMGQWICHDVLWRVQCQTCHQPPPEMQAVQAIQPKAV